MNLELILTKLVFNECAKTSHFGLTMAIVYLTLKENSARASVTCSRKTLMKYARIKSITTYHKTIKDLCEMGIIRYRPSFDPRTATEMEIII